MTDYSPLNLTSTAAPQTQEELAALVADAHASGTPLNPIGGGTSLDYGLVPKRPGIGVVLTGLNRVIDFPARDLTVTVEPGITLQALADVLAKEGLRLPVDAPLPERATLGGVIATGWSGPRRYGHGTIRDYVIGIRAIDGRGEVFNGGGRVVKNVAGYDFCKLLTGSLGTIGIIGQVTLKLKPVAERTALQLMPAAPKRADELLAAIVASDLTPAVLDWRSHSEQPGLLVLLEGTFPEVVWMNERLQAIAPATTLQANEDWSSIRDFSAQSASLLLKASVRPSQVMRFATEMLAAHPAAQIHAHAGNGIVYSRFSEFPKEGLSRTLIGKLQPLAAECGGHVVVLSNPSGQEATPQSTWGHLGGQLALMQEVKHQFDPRNILNPGRYVFP